MALKINFFVVAKIFLYFVSIVCGLVVAITVGVTTANFNQQCLLYADVTWDKDKSYFTVDYSSTSICSFPVYLSSIVAVVYALAVGIYHVYALIRLEPENGTSVVTMLITLINGLVTITFFVCACIISVGFKSFCDDFVDGRPHESCEQAEHANWHDYDGSTLHQFLAAAEIACWILFLDWLILVGLDVGRMILNRRRPS